MNEDQGRSAIEKIASAAPFWLPIGAALRQVGGLAGLRAEAGAPAPPEECKSEQPTSKLYVAHRLGYRHIRGRGEIRSSGCVPAVANFSNTSRAGS